jgi:hypothetical protein
LQLVPAKIFTIVLMSGKYLKIHKYNIVDIKQHSIKTYGKRVKVKLSVFSTSTPYKYERAVSRSVHFNPGTQLMVGCVDPTAGIDVRALRDFESLLPRPQSVISLTELSWQSTVLSKLYLPVVTVFVY